MNSPSKVFAVAIVVAVTGLEQAIAAPPTVTPSPGYDARLQEQRKANAGSSSTMGLRPAPPPTVARHHARRKH